MKEKNLKKRVMLACSVKHGTVVFNNPVGFDEITKTHYGLTKGSSDLIGWRKPDRSYQ